MSELIHIRPISYRLDIDDERHKKLRPYFKLSSGPYSRTSKRMEPTEKGSQNVLKMGKKDEKSMKIELWDRNELKKENLLGSGTLDFSKLEGKNGVSEEWILLYDKDGKQIGKALIEVELAPEDRKLTNKDLFHGVVEDARNRFGGFLEDSTSLFDKMLNDTNKLFEEFEKDFEEDEIIPEIKEEKHDTSLRTREAEKSKLIEEKPKSIKAKPKANKEQKAKKGGHQVAKDAGNRFNSLIENQSSLFNDMIEDTRRIFDEFAKDIWEDEDFIFPSLFSSRGKRTLEGSRQPESIKEKETPKAKPREEPKLAHEGSPKKLDQTRQSPKEAKEEKKPEKIEKDEARIIRKPEEESMQLPWSQYEEELKKKFENLMQQQQKMFNDLLVNSRKMLENAQKDKSSQRERLVSPDRPKEKSRVETKDISTEGRTSRSDIYEDVRSGFDRMFNKMMQDSHHAFDELLTHKTPNAERSSADTHLP